MVLQIWVYFSYSWWWEPARECEVCSGAGSHCGGQLRHGSCWNHHVVMLCYHWLSLSSLTIIVDRHRHRQCLPGTIINNIIIIIVIMGMRSIFARDQGGGHKQSLRRRGCSKDGAAVGPALIVMMMMIIIIIMIIIKRWYHDQKVISWSWSWWWWWLEHLSRLETQCRAHLTAPTTRSVF